MLWKVAIACVLVAVVAASPGGCGPNTKASQNGTCIPLSNYDVIRAIHWLAKPPAVTCKKITVVQDIAVCEDNLPKKCVIWSEITSNYCDHYGSLEFEKYWAGRGCAVTLFHYTMSFRANVCTLPEGKMADHPNINIIRSRVWKGTCYNCFYDLARKQLLHLNQIDVLKIQGREGVNEDFDGVQYSVLSDLYWKLPAMSDLCQQVVLTVSINTNTLTDHVGREAEHAWNMYATQRLLKDFASFSSKPELGPSKLRPLQYTHLLQQAKLDPNYGIYRQSFMKLSSEGEMQKQRELFEAWVPNPVEVPVVGVPPAYCDRTPAIGTEKNQEMQEWILGEMNARCHATRLHVPCTRTRGYDSIMPCPHELAANLAEDYAVTKGWCNFSHPAAVIPMLQGVDIAAFTAFKQPSLAESSSARTNTVSEQFRDYSQNKYLHNENHEPRYKVDEMGSKTNTVVTNKVRLAFFFTVYSDAAFVLRLFSKLYSPTHYYLFHIDNSVGGVSSEFLQTMRQLTANHSNVHLCKDVPIVYGASTATILLTKAMHWFDKHATGWDYFVPLTGSDYPLVPLRRIEEIFAFQQPPMPFVMAWTPGTSTHIFRLEKTHPEFETDPLLIKSIKAVTDERGKVLGAVPMEFRSNNFGPPLFCNNRSSFVHLDNRQNKSARIFDTQWLFPKDTFRNRGRVSKHFSSMFSYFSHHPKDTIQAYAEENPVFTTPSFDGGWRVWKKSDPATTGAYDRQSVDYIINSQEGRKYYHFFKHMLLGSEEHYYVSLLYNWPRTRAFVQSLSAQIVWNTWELGLWEQQQGFQTHTHFLSLNEIDILAGFSKRGMMFARKFSSKKTSALLDRIDATFLREGVDGADENMAGSHWPGFFKVDTTTPGKEWVAKHRANNKLKNINSAAKNANKQPGKTMKGSKIA